MQIMSSAVRFLAFAGAGAALLAGAVTACGSASVPPSAQPSVTITSQAAKANGFAGYKWIVASIGHDGKNTPIPAKLLVYLEFTPNGEFGANEPVNFHSGTYQATSGGFTTSQLSSTLVGYAGHDPVVLLSVSAISTFDEGAHALTTLTGDTLTITVNGYTLIARRAGSQANWPAPSDTKS